MALNWRTFAAAGTDRRVLTRGPRVVRVVGDIDEDMLQACTRTFSRIVASGQDCIPVLVHSSGGDLYVAMALMALFESSPVPVVTVCTGQAYSAGALIFSCGSKRYAAPYATLMLHQVSLDGIAGTAREVTNEARELERANAAAFARLDHNTGQPPGYFSALVKQADGDVYMDAASAVGHKLATDVGVPHVEVHVSIRMTVSTGPWTAPRAVELVPPRGDDDDDDGGGGTPSSGGRKRKRRRRRRDDADGSDDSDSDDSDDE
jgi:ATP-dependent protease ClpP protease subunit